MSAGSVHAKASLILAAGFSVGALIYQEPKMLECTLGALTGILLSGDLDVDAGNISHSIIRKRFGWVFGFVWRWFWRDYSGSFKHGKFASHFPYFSTPVRLWYIYFKTILPFYLILYVLFPSAFTLGLAYELSWWAQAMLSPMFLYGLCSSDLIHFFLDILTKEKSN